MNLCVIIKPFAEKKNFAIKQKVRIYRDCECTLPRKENKTEKKAERIDSKIYLSLVSGLLNVKSSIRNQ